MRYLWKSLFMGLGGGAAATLLILHAWGTHYAKEYLFSAQPRLLQTYLAQQMEDVAAAEGHMKLEDPWLPELSGALHDSWPMNNLAGKSVTLGDFKGKVVFLDLWSISCGPCVGEMPAIKNLADSMKKDNVAFVLPARDGETEVREFLHKHPIDLPIYLAKGGPPDLPAVAIPATYVLDRQGNAVFREIGAVNWDSDNVRAFLRGLENH